MSNIRDEETDEDRDVKIKKYLKAVRKLSKSLFKCCCGYTKIQGLSSLMNVFHKVCQSHNLTEEEVRKILLDLHNANIENKRYLED